MIDPEKYVEAGQALQQLGRYLQRTFPPVSIAGCQHDEGPILDKLLPGNDGIFVEIGANDGIECSNSYQFFKRGWRGLLIEPLIDVIPSLLLNRPGDIICPLAASDVDGYGILNVCRSVSSLDACWRKDNEARMPVRTERLETILKRYPAVDWSKTRFCSIDCEGSEGAVLRGINWDTFRPEVFCIEFADQNGVDISGLWKGILDANGYTVYWTGKLNQIWQRQHQ